MWINERAVEKRDRLRRLGESQEGFGACRPPFLLRASLFSARVEAMLIRLLAGHASHVVQLVETA